MPLACMLLSSLAFWALPMLMLWSRLNDSIVRSARETGFQVKMRRRTPSYRKGGRSQPVDFAGSSIASADIGRPPSSCNGDLSFPLYDQRAHRRPGRRVARYDFAELSSRLLRILPQAGGPHDASEEDGQYRLACARKAKMLKTAAFPSGPYGMLQPALSEVNS